MDNRGSTVCNCNPNCRPYSLFIFNYLPLDDQIHAQYTVTALVTEPSECANCSFTFTLTLYLAPLTFRSTRPQIGVINGVLLISWRQAVLQKQIDYGAKLGHVVLSLAKMELENFFKNVMPVADYFDQSDLLLAVSNCLPPSPLPMMNIYR